MRLDEDTLYRQSTQYKNWSFTPAKLAQLRQLTNARAADQVKLHIAQDCTERAKAAPLDVSSAPDSGTNTPNGAGTGANTPIPGADKEVDCLTMDEEKMVVDKFCTTAMQLGNFLNLTADVTATAIQFMRRFYLYNSPMTYDGSKIAKAATFIALKLELGTRSGSASDFASRLPKTTRDDITAPEYTIVQALRFNFDVRHPFRGLKGLHLELEDMVSGVYTAPSPAAPAPAQLQAQALEALDVPSEAAAVAKLGNVYAHAKDILTMAAQLTDAYFLFTPSQILLSAHHLATPTLTTLYLTTKLPPSSPLLHKITSTLHACATLLSAHRSYTPVPAPSSEKYAWADADPPALRKIMKKLKGCRDPLTQDLVALNQGRKRDVVREGGLEEGKAKKRRLNRERAEKESEAFWGPELKKEG